MEGLGTDWKGFMSNIQTSCLSTHKLEDDLKTYFSKMFSFLKRKSHLHWHIEYFRLYLSDNICPVGLRVQIFPTIKDPSVDLKKTWENILLNCSVELIKTLVVQYSQDMNILDQEIDRLNTQFVHLVGNSVFNDKWKELKARLETLNREIIINKQTKFNKDKVAFSDGYAYKWAGTQNGRRAPRRDPHGGNLNREVESDSSLSSLASQQSSLRFPATPAINSTRKRLRYGGGTPPTLSKKEKKGPKGPKGTKTRALQARDLVDTNLSSEGATCSTSLHGAIPKVLNSILMTQKHTKSNEEVSSSFLDVKKQQGNLDTYVLKTNQSLPPPPQPTLPTMPTLIS